MRNSVQKKLIAAVFAISILPIFALSGYQMYSTDTRLRADVHAQIEGIAQAKIASLDAFLDAIRRSTASVAKTAAVVGALAQPGEPTKVALDTVRQFQEAHWGMFHHVMLVDRSGHAVLSPPHGESTSSHTGQNVSTSVGFKPGLEAPTATDFFGFEEKDHYHQLFFHPVHDTAGVSVGAVVVEVCVNHVRGLLGDGTAFGGAGQLRLFALDGTEVVHGKSEASPPRTDAAFVTASTTGRMAGDYDGVDGIPVVGLLQRHGDNPWIVAVEVDAATVYAPVRHHALVSGGVAFALAIIILIAGASLGRRLSQPLREMADVADAVAHGHLSSTVHEHGHDEIGRLGRALNAAVANTRGMVTEITHGSAKLGPSSSALVATSERLRTAADHTADDFAAMAVAQTGVSTVIDQMADALTNLSASIEEVSASARSTDELVGATVAAAGRAAESVVRLGRGSDEIESVARDIASVAGQTNLLALNATIEAARAGDAGRGFGVVAHEVKELATRTADLTASIDDRIRAIRTDVGHTSAAIQHISDQVAQIEQASAEVRCAVDEQSRHTHEMRDGAAGVAIETRDIADRVERLAQVVREAATGAGETHATAEMMAELSRQLQRTAATFDIGDEA